MTDEDIYILCSFNINTVNICCTLLFITTSWASLIQVKVRQFPICCLIQGVRNFINFRILLIFPYLLCEYETQNDKKCQVVFFANYFLAILYFLIFFRRLILLKSECGTFLPTWINHNGGLE